MENTLLKTDFELPGQQEYYRGKVRDVYFLDNDLLVMIASDRISAFDKVLGQGIPYKGQVLNQLSTHFLAHTRSTVPNWHLSSPHPMVSIGRRAETFPVEMVIRGYLTGHAWREYKSGKRQLCGVDLPEGMRENEAFPEPIITPTTKASHGQHDEDISREEILRQELVDPETYAQLEKYTRQLFRAGQQFAAERELILVDTKYEFGKDAAGNILLIDEIHTPDSSRYFYRDGYEERLENGEPQRQLSKEFVRQWLMERGFQGQPGQALPEMDSSFVASVSERYQELYRILLGKPFEKHRETNLQEAIHASILEELPKWQL